jgi:hypothetical protein
MATINKIYPHVNVTTRALLRQAVEAVDNGATTLFVPFYSKKGLSGQVQKVFNETQFISEYGEPDFEYQGRTILNVYNWLNSGGAVYSLRLTAPDATNSSGLYSYATSYFDETAKRFYTYSNGVWSFISVPAVGVVVTSEPAIVTGSYYYNSSNGEVFQEVSGSWAPVTLTNPSYFFDSVNKRLYTYSGSSPAWNAGVILPTNDVTNFRITAKHPGSYYNDISLFITKSRFSTAQTPLLDVQILLEGKRLQSLFRLSETTFVETLKSTDYIGSAAITSFYTESTSDTFLTLVNAIGFTGVTVSLSGGSDGSFTFEQSLARFYGSMNIGTALTSTTSFNLTSLALGTTATFTVPSTSGYKLVVGDKVRASGSSLTNFIEGLVTAITPTSISITVATKGGTGEVSSWTISLVTLSSNYPLASKLLENKLEHQFDVVFDAGYPLVIKNAIREFSLIRDDVFFFFDNVNFSVSEEKGETVVFSASEMNQAVYIQRLLINETISGKSIWVSPTYFLASLVPFNDRIYGIQYSTAGEKYGVLTGVEAIDFNPTSDEKNTFYISRENYIEKDSRGYKFMSRSTGDGFVSAGIYEETALRFINNARVTNRMVRELELLGRDYLFEFNDSSTLNNMRNALNRYVSNWIQNRTLTLGTVLVEKDPNSDERVNVTLNIRFTGTIEIISIDITIE